MPIKLGGSKADVRLAKVIAFHFFAAFCLSQMSAVIHRDALSELGTSTSGTLPTAPANFHTVMKAWNQNHHV